MTKTILKKMVCRSLTKSATLLDSSDKLRSCYRTSKLISISSRSAKSAKAIEMIDISKLSNLTIDVRQAMIKSREVVNTENCTALEIECVQLQSHSSAILPIQHEKIEQNSTKPAHAHHHDGIEIIFVPINSTDSTDVHLQPKNQTKPMEHETSHLHDMKWPWSAEVFVNGELVANGVLLDKSWVLVESNSVGSSQEPLHKNFVAVLVGNTRSQLKIQNPYEQIGKVDCLQYVNDSNVALLHVETPLDFNRHVLPSFLPIA